MKRKRSILILCLLSWVCAFSTAVALPVVEWDTISYSPGFHFSSPGATVWGYTVMGSDGGAGYIELYADNVTVGISHQWFEVAYGELIDASTTASSDALARQITAQPIEYGSLRIYENTPYYMGFQLGGYAASGYAAEFGWAELSYDGSDLTMIASASERTGLGIYAGTGTAIPEPAMMGLLGIGALGLAWRKRKN